MAQSTWELEDGVDYVVTPSGSKASTHPNVELLENYI